MYEKSIFLFHRDLRLEDNIGLIESLQKSKQVIPCFIYDCNLIRKLKDAKFRWRFLDESLLDLDKNLKKKGSSLQILEGIPEKILEKIIKKYKIEAVFSNTDFSKKIPLIIACISAAKKINKEIKIICGDINKNSISKYVSNS